MIASSTIATGTPSIASRPPVRRRSATGGLLAVLQRHEVAGEVDQAHLAARDLGHDPAAIEHDQPVGDLEHVRQVVLDVDAGPAAGLDALHEVQDLLHLLDRQGRGRLVEHDQVFLEVHRPADRDALALAARELRHRAVGVDADAAKADLVLEDPVGDPPLARRRR